MNDGSVLFLEIEYILAVLHYDSVGDQVARLDCK